MTRLSAIVLLCVGVLFLLAAAVVLADRARADDLACPAGQHRALVPGGHRCDVGAVVRGETP